MALVDDVKVKIVIKKLIDVSYSMNEETTTKLLAEKGGITLSIDQHGDVRLSGAAGLIRFNGNPTLKEIGINIKYASIYLYDLPGGRMGFRAAIHTPNKGVVGGELAVLGSFDLVELIRSNSGGLGRAYRAIEGRPDFIDRIVNGAQGN